LISAPPVTVAPKGITIMTTQKMAALPEGAAPLAINWREIARAAFGSAIVAGLVGGALHALGKVIEAELDAEAKRLRDATSGLHVDDVIGPGAVHEPAPGAFHTDVDGAREDDNAPGDDNPPDAAAEAAALLGVPLDASVDEIRAALRAHLTLSRLHPDQGGDGEEAKKLIAAKNSLVERARAVRP
jgi:hypothetical protein